MAINQSLEDIIENFDFLDDWEDKYMYIIDLGRMLPAFDEKNKSPQNLVEGCTSKVWLTKTVITNGNTLVDFNADSESQIVKGLVALLIVIYSGKTPSEIAEINSEEIFAKLQLSSHLSTNRANGLRAMVQRIQAEAKSVG